MSTEVCSETHQPRTSVRTKLSPHGALMCALSLASLSKGNVNICSRFTCLWGYQVMLMPGPAAWVGGWLCKDWGRLPTFYTQTLTSVTFFLKRHISCSLTSDVNRVLGCIGWHTFFSKIVTRKTVDCWSEFMLNAIELVMFNLCFENWQVTHFRWLLHYKCFLSLITFSQNKAVHCSD